MLETLFLDVATDYPERPMGSHFTTLKMWRVQYFTTPLHFTTLIKTHGGTVLLIVGE
jgi:hypothetical protein